MADGNASICRACLGSEETVLWDSFYLETYNKLTDLSATLDDDLPQALCSRCRDLINTYIHFKDMCIKSETSLHSVKLEKSMQGELKTLEIPDFAMSIKCENDDMFDYDFCQIEDSSELNIKSELDDTYIPPIKIKRRPRQSTINLKKEKADKIKDINRKHTRKSKKENVKRLQNEVKSNEKFKCGLCTEKLNGREILQIHIQNHIKTLECIICNVKFTCSTDLVMHRFEHVDEEDRYCHLCCRKFKIVQMIRNHYMAEHGPKGPSTTCSFCGTVFETMRKLRKHLHSNHTDLEYTCDICQKQFRNKQMIQRHIVTHTGIKLYKCNECDLKFKYHSQLKTHKRRLHGLKQAYCKNCTRHFNEETISKHICNKNVICEVCGKDFKTNKALQRHADSHSLLPKYKCELCLTEFRARGSLKIHMNRHAGIKPYSCDYCPLRFYSCSVLIKHKRVHTGERPYVCQYCGKGFTANHNLKVHMKVHGINNLIVKKGEQGHID